MFGTIIFFIVTALGLGSLFANLLKKESLFERMTITLGLGISLWVVLGSVMALFKIPLVWWLFLTPSILLLVWLSYSHRWFFRGITVNWKKAVIPLLIFAITASMHLTGTFKQSYLHDDDPWGHAEGSKYVAVEKNINPPVPEGGIRLFGYLGSYPP